MNNKLLIKIYNGTNPDKHLCPDCRYANITEDSGGDSTVFCQVVKNHISTRVVKCNTFSEKDNSHFREMLQAGTIIKLEPNGQILAGSYGDTEHGYYQYIVVNGQIRKRKHDQHGDIDESDTQGIDPDATATVQ